MSGITAAAQRVGRAGRRLLPTGQLLTPEVWARRHRGILWLLWAHVAGIAVFAVVRGYGLAHAATEASLVVVFALAATSPALGRRARASAAVLGLITASAVIVHLSGPRLPGRRPGPQGGGQRVAGRGPLHRPAGPLRRRGVRAAPAGLRPGRRRGHREASAGG